MNDGPFHVVTCNLAPDLCSAAPAYRLSDFGALDESQLLVVLELLRAIAPVQNDDAAPHVLIEAPAGRFRVTTRDGKLFLHEAARRGARTGVELAAAAIALHLAQSPNAAASIIPAVPTRRTRWKVTYALLGVALLVIGYRLCSA